MYTPTHRTFLSKKKNVAISLVAGNFSDSLPKMAWVHTHGHTHTHSHLFHFVSNFNPHSCDCYILKDILENWSDEDAAVILSNVRKVASDKSRLLVIERTLHTGSHSEEKVCTAITCNICLVEMCVYLCVLSTVQGSDGSYHDGI